MTEQQRELIARLARECAESIDGEVEGTYLDVELMALLPTAVAELEFDDDVVTGTLDLLATSSEHVSVDDRRRLTDAAKQGARHNLRAHQPLQLVLQQARAESQLDAVSVASGLGIPPEELTAFEAGNRPLIQLDPQKLAQWVEHMGVGVEICGTRNPAVVQPGRIGSSVWRATARGHRRAGSSLHRPAPGRPERSPLAQCTLTSVRLAGRLRGGVPCCSSLG